MTSHTSSSERSASLAAFQAQIERAWTENRDIDLPIQLADENPDLAEELLDFFDELVLGTITSAPTREQQEEAATRLQARLRQTGLSHIADAVERAHSEDYADVSHTEEDAYSIPEEGELLAQAPPNPLLNEGNDATDQGAPSAPEHALENCEDYYDYADRLGYTPDDIAKAFGLPLATAHRLIVHSTELRPKVQQCMARRGAEHLDRVDYKVGLSLLAGHPNPGMPRQYQSISSRREGYTASGGFSYVDEIRNAPATMSEEDRQFWLSLAGDETRENQ